MASPARASGHPRSGRPRASSRETLAEAACELFLEQGYEATSIADISQRAGVSRSSFFNYFGSKSDVLWSGLDARIERIQESVGAGMPVADAMGAALSDFVPDALAVALVNARTMGADDELERDAAVRAARVARAVADRARGAGSDALRSEVEGAVVGGALIAALRIWAAEGPGTTSLLEVVTRALDVAGRGTAPAVGADGSARSPFA
ncbi:TetR/AcrR family transcriptional regulator [Microbacterium pseudoresistens]|uniref:AcrR family transcriptional regulator n=1 Tax=Microbacterium pseudoresistens TaxID=640634 RepID=A0A7Y9EWI3_9MICO|nr:TetR/AcrR family transcriptional regulator [Microbacterium pseudoresistens]NYD55245.1 AcrR family transcriptional regulator [Microbacterium pseudoresistens]